MTSSGLECGTPAPRLAIWQRRKGADKGGKGERRVKNGRNRSRDGGTRGLKRLCLGLEHKFIPLDSDTVSVFHTNVSKIKFINFCHLKLIN